MKKDTVQENVQGAEPKGEAASQGLTRRGLLSRSGVMAAGMASAPLWMPNAMAAASSAASQHTLVIVFLRGGCDGLSMVAPRLATGGADTFYTAQRQTPAGGPQLAIPLPAAGNGVTALTDPTNAQLPWMLSAGAASALTMYQNQELAFVHGVGFPVSNNGSHFFSQDYMEDGTLLSAQPSDGLGWAGRGMQNFTSSQSWRGMGYSKLLQRTLFGAPKTVAIPDPMNYDLNGTASTIALRKLGIELLYKVSDEPLKSNAADSLDTVKKINNPAIFAKPSTAAYPVGSMFGAQLKKVQQLIQASADTNIDVCLETVMIDYGGWDNHVLMGPTPNTVANPSGEGMHNRMKDVFDSMAAMYADLKTHAPTANYTMVFMTEFGRRITANGSSGVDHGAGSLMAIMGSNHTASPSLIKGKNVYTMLPNPAGGDGVTPGWAGLQTHSVLQGGATASYNLLKNIDYRRVLGELLDKRAGLDTTKVRNTFPGYIYDDPTDARTKPLGIFS